MRRRRPRRAPAAPPLPGRRPRIFSGRLEAPLPSSPALLHRRDEPGAAGEPGGDHGAENEVDRAEERIPPGANQPDSQLPRPKSTQGLTRSSASWRARWR
uniref:Pco064740 n=1 Tax=Arundo donax TaxID=35708 RepID=A0A0A9DAQ3_ARUDO